MTVTQRIVSTEKSADDFIKGAPDGRGKTPPKPGKTGKVPISVQVQPERLAQLDAIAASVGLSRSGIVSLAIQQLIDRGVEMRGANQ